MKKALRFISFFLILAALFGAIFFLVPDQFEESYQRALVTQYDYFRSIEDNKIVFVGNSSLAYGFDLDEMEELTGKQCAILGNHAGYGMTYLLEMSKTNLKSGDIVVIEYFNNTMKTCGAELLLTGIGKRYDMYDFFHPRTYGEVAKEFIPVLLKECRYSLSGGYRADGAYSMEAFDSRGNMIYDRDACEIPYPYTEEVAETYKWIYFTDDFDDGFIDYLNEYNRYCNELGVSVYMTIPCYMDESVKSSIDDIRRFDETLSGKVEFPLISRSEDYIFPREYMYNAVAHCNNEGTKVRTEQLYEDLKPYLP